MFAGVKEQTEKKNGKKIAVGYDLGSVASQISYCTLEEQRVETAVSYTHLSNLVQYFKYLCRSYQNCRTIGVFCHCRRVLSNGILLINHGHFCL